MPDPSNSQEQEITLAKALANAKQLKSERYPSNAEVRTAMKEIKKEGKLKKRYKKYVRQSFSPSLGYYNIAKDDPENYQRIGVLEFFFNRRLHEQKSCVEEHAFRVFTARKALGRGNKIVSSLNEIIEPHTTKVEEIEKCLVNLKACRDMLEESIPKLNKTIKKMTTLKVAIARIRWAVPFLKRNATYSERAKQLQQQKKIVRDLKKLTVIKIAYMAVKERDNEVLKIAEKKKTSKKGYLDKQIELLRYQKLLLIKCKEKGIKSKELKKWSRSLWCSEIPKDPEWDKLVEGCDVTRLAVTPVAIVAAVETSRKESLLNRNLPRGMSSRLN